jgi:hypothetical protein
MDGDELLLLADRAQEPQRVGPEADQPQDCQRSQADRRAPCDAQALAHALGREQEKRQHEPGRDLDADAHHECGGGGAKARTRPDRQRQRGGEQEHQHGVVVCAAHRQLEHHGIQADECRGPGR